MLEEAQDIPKITEQETPTERKPQARTQERRKKLQDMLPILWENRTPSPWTQLPSLRTVVPEVW